MITNKTQDYPINHITKLKLNKIYFILNFHEDLALIEILKNF